MRELVEAALKKEAELGSQQRQAMASSMAALKHEQRTGRLERKAQAWEQAELRSREQARVPHSHSALALLGALFLLLARGSPRAPPFARLPLPATFSRTTCLVNLCPFFLAPPARSAA